MPNLKGFSIFISHASEDASLAAALQQLIEAALKSPPKERLIFCSSDVGIIEGGADWYEAIIRAIRESRICLTLMTPTSVHKPWVLYESGAAYAIYRSKSNRLISVCALGISPGLIPSPFKRLQTRSLDDPAQLEQLLRELAKLLGRPCRVSHHKIKAVARKAEDPTGGWASVQSSRVSTHSESSPFRVDRALAVAKKHILLAGQCLHYVATTKDQAESILKFLGDDPRRHLDILLCDPSNKVGVKAWTTVNPDLRGSRYTYKTNLHEACIGFASLISEAHKRKIRGLSIRVVGIVPYGATVVDPELNSGVIAFQPVVNHGPKAAERPQFIVTKTENPEVFEYYWRCLRTAFDFGKDLKQALGH